MSNQIWILPSVAIGCTLALVVPGTDFKHAVTVCLAIAWAMDSKDYTSRLAFVTLFSWSMISAGDTSSSNNRKSEQQITGLTSLSDVRCKSDDRSWRPMTCHEQSSFQSHKVIQKDLVTRLASSIETYWQRLQSYFSYQERVWVDAVLRGKVYALKTGVVDWFRSTGMLHLLVVSGYHFTFLLGIAEQLILLPLRAISSISIWDTRRQNQCIVAAKIIVAIIGFFLLTFLACTPPAQRAYCCYLVRVLCDSQHRRFNHVVRIEFAIGMHAATSPIGLTSSSGVLSWLIYLSLVGCGIGYRAMLQVQVQICLIVSCIFAKMNIAGFLLNFTASIIGALMMFSAIIPAPSIFLELNAIRHFNLMAIDFFLSAMRWFSDRTIEYSDWLSYKIGSFERFALAVTWGYFLLRRFARLAHVPGMFPDRLKR